MALLAWDKDETASFLRQVWRLEDAYQSKVFEHEMDTTHDLGFLYSLYSVSLYKTTGVRKDCKVALRAADVLAARFNPKGNFIRAWGRMDESKFDGLAFISSLMNLPLLFWASEVTGNETYRRIAVRHADTTLKYFIRSDGSIFHAYQFNPETGRPISGVNHCGYAANSHWARGTAWAIYGFALSFRYTLIPKYLKASQALALTFLKNLETGAIPVWDFRLPRRARRIHDSSAAAIAVCGLQEILEHAPNNMFLRTAKLRILKSLCSDDYLDSNETCPGILKQGQIINGSRAAKNAYTSWGDYFLMEALSRELKGGETFW
jgi:unsaturated chondroitin disaccharide hydrolase